MAHPTINAINSAFGNNVDGWEFAGGQTLRTLTFTGGDYTLDATVWTANQTKLDYISVSASIDLDNQKQDLADIITLSGVSANSTNLGTFTGTTISDSVTIKVALQELETALEGISISTNLGYTASPTNGTVTSDTGTDATLTLATGVNAGLFAPADFTKLGHITVTQAVDLDNIEQDLADVITLTGVAANSTNLGTFTGSTITDNVTIKTALQELETAVEGGSVDHGALTGLNDDDHSQYALLNGRTGGQTLIGGDAASNSLILRSTSNVSKGNIIIEGPFWSDKDDTTKSVNINLTAITAAVTRTWTVPDRDLNFSSGGTFAELSHTHAAADVTTGTFDNARISQTSVTQHEGAINHDALLNFASDEHVAHSGVTLTAGIGLTGGGTIESNRTFDLDIPGLTDLTDAGVLAGADTFAVYNATAVAHEEATITQLQTYMQNNLTLETTIVSIDGTPQTTGNPTLDFDGTDFSITESPADTFDITINNSGIDHNSTTNYVADQHVAHTGVDITAGNGLTGGGDISVSRTIHVGAGTGIDVAADSISVDVSDFMSNGAVNRVLTATGTDAFTAETSFTYTGGTYTLTATAFTAGNYVFNIDETVGVGQDNYVLTYDNGTGEIGLEAATGGGFTVTPDTNNYVVTADGSGGGIGEANLTFDGNNLQIAAGSGIPNTGADDLVINRGGEQVNAGISILTGNNQTAALYMGDDADPDRGGLTYAHLFEQLTLRVAGSNGIQVTGTNRIVTLNTYGDGNRTETTPTYMIAVDVDGKLLDFPITSLSKSITVESPSTSEDISMFFTNQAITITEMRAVIRGGTNITWTIRHGTDRSAAGSEVVTGGTTTASSTTGDDITAFNDATIVADSFVWLETTAITGGVNELHITIVYTVD